MHFFQKYLLFFISLIGVSFHGWAQVTYDGCRDFRGSPVASVLDTSINDVAIARIENSRAVIRYNPNVLAQMSEPTRRFFYVHECAHHVLRHTIQNPSLENERAADCWAINTMKDTFGISRRELNAIQRDIARQGQGDWTHLPGPHRAIDIGSCLSLNQQNRPAEPFGYPSGYTMQQCGCWGVNPFPEVQEPACQSGYVRLEQCQGGCQRGGSPYSYVCQ